MIVKYNYDFCYFSCSFPSSFIVCQNSTTISGSEVLEKFKMTDLSIGETFAIMWSVIIILQMFFYFSLRFRGKPK